MFARRSVASKTSAIIPNSFHASRGEISWPSPAAFSSFSCVIVSGTDPEKTLLLVDGSSYLYRAYHALPELRSPKTGEPTGAIYGVLNMLRKLATDYKAQARAAVFDAKGRTFRDELYADYKATRTAMPDDLSRQIEPLHEAVQALGWPLHLRKVKDWLPKARELLTVKRDVPLDVTLDDLVDGKGDPAKQRAQYERFGFKSWQKEVENAPMAEAPAAPPPSVQKRRARTILAEDELRDLLLKIEAAPLVALSCIGSGEDPMSARLVGLAFAFGDQAVYLPVAHDYAGAPAQLGADGALRLLKPWLERADCRKVTEDAKLDSHMFANHGVRLAGCVHDTIIESYVLEVH